MNTMRSPRTRNSVSYITLASLMCTLVPFGGCATETGTGTAVGAGSGAVVGGILGYFFGGKEGAAWGTAGGAVAGGVIGYKIGSDAKEDREAAQDDVKWLQDSIAKAEAEREQFAAANEALSREVDGLRKKQQQLVAMASSPDYGDELATFSQAVENSLATADKSIEQADYRIKYTQEVTKQLSAGNASEAQNLQLKSANEQISALEREKAKLEQQRNTLAALKSVS